MQTNQTDNIIFFDGVCHLCNGAIDYIIRREKQPTFKFSSLQSDFAQRFLKEKNPSLLNEDSIILAKDDQLFIASQAVVQILLSIGGVHAVLGKLIQILPIKFSDFIYHFIAKRRYRWFGKSETCRLPSKEERDRFLE